MSGFVSVAKIAQCFRVGIGNNRILNTVICPLYGINHSYATSVEEKLGLNKPKRPVPAFFKFLKQVRPTLVSKNPGVKSIGIVKLASKHWEQLSQDVKGKLNSEYEEEIKEYKKKNLEFKKSLTPEQEEKIHQMKSEIEEKKKKKQLKAELKDLGRPKRPLSSYFLFALSQQDKVKGDSVVQRSALVAEKWKNMSSQEKSVYQQKYKELNDAYQKQLVQWEQKMIRMGNIDYVRNKALVPPNKEKSNKTKSE